MCHYPGVCVCVYVVKHTHAPCAEVPKPALQSTLSALQTLFRALSTLLQTACESCVTTVIEKNTGLKQADQLCQLCSQCSSDPVNHDGSTAFKINSSYSTS